MDSGPGIFVAYAESDRAWVRGFLVPSMQASSVTVLTKDQFSPGASLLRETESAIGRVRVTVLVLSKAFLADEWSIFSDVLATWAELGRGPGRGVTVVPLLLDDADVPLHLDAKVSLDCRRAEDWEPAMARLRALLNAPSPSDEQLPCPYPGMAPFQATQENVFFGRDDELRELSLRAAHQSLLAVLGPSGCGKSSLALGGLAPRLQHSTDTGWLVRATQPGAAPFQELCRAISASPTIPPREIVHAVTALLRDHEDRERVLLVVDQAETVFAQASAPRREAFVSAVRALRESRCSCLLLMFRADALADLMESRLWPFGPYERLELVTLSRKGLREAIERPAAAAGVHIEPVLVERLLHDCAQEPGALPLLQETLRLLWRRRSRRLLTLSAYEDLAGTDTSLLSTALVMHADAALASLSPDEQVVARRTLLRLVQPGDGRAHTRRREPLSSLRHTCPDQATADRVIRHLSERRILTVGRPGPAEPAHVDLAHESLITKWEVFERWIDEDRADETRRRRLEHDAQVWRESKRDRDLVYRGHRLLEAWEWTGGHAGELSDTAMSFLAAGRRRRTLRITAATTLAGVMTIGLVALAAPRFQEFRLRRETIGLGEQVRVDGGVLPAFNGATANTIADLWVDVHEVTNREYELCMRAGRCGAPVASTGVVYSSRLANLPVVDVTAEQAFVYCEWVGRRLPTAPEWLWVAVGAFERPYPWGRAPPTPQHANLSFDRDSRLVDTTGPHYSRGESPEGVRHLFGNAWEWTASQGQGEDGSIVVRRQWNGKSARDVLTIGAGFDLAPGLVPAHRGMLATGVAGISALHNETLGFRCVRTAG